MEIRFLAVVIRRGHRRMMDSVIQTVTQAVRALAREPMALALAARALILAFQAFRGAYAAARSLLLMFFAVISGWCACALATHWKWK